MQGNRKLLCILIMILCLSASVRVFGADSASWKGKDKAVDQASSLSKELGAEIAIHRVLPGEEGITADYQLQNQGGKEQNVIVLLTAYDAKGSVRMSDSKEVSLQPKKPIHTSLTLRLSREELSACASVKAFVWSADQYRPLTVAAKESQLFDQGDTSMRQASLFDGYEVELTGDSYFQKQLAIGANYLNYYDVDRLAASLYVNNLSEKSPGEVYGGWEGGGLPGHSVGHYLSACVAMYMQTGEENFKNRAERLVGLIKEAQYEDGYVGGVAKSRMDNVFNNPDTFWAGGHNNAYLDGMWAPWYSIHKIYAGLIDAYLYLGNEDALQIAEGMATYAKNGTDKLSAERMEYMLEGEYGGINESFAQLYEITGKEEYLVLAKRFSHKKIMDPLARGEDHLSGLHANTQIPKIVGAAKIYQLTGEEYYKNVAQNFWKYVVYDRSYATGGNCDKEFFTELGTEPRSVDSTETCNVYNMLKLTEYLYSVDPKTEYLEYYENVLYNHILGSQNQDGDKTYNIDLTMGGRKNYFQHCKEFTCCEGTGMENPGRYYRMIYTKMDDALGVNLLIDSRLTWEEKGIVLKQTTDFPYSDQSTLCFEQAQGNRIPLKIRIPKWAKGAQITVNHKRVDAVFGKDGYLTVANAWKAGDTIQITTPMDYSLYVSREDPQGKVVAFRYGPILLAGELGKEKVPYIVTETRNPAEILKKEETGKLRFSIPNLLQPGAKSIMLKPFFEFVSENYMVYWNLYTQEQYEASGGAQNTFEERLDSASYDVVYPNRAESETEHRLQTVGVSQSGDWNGKGWRSAIGPASFSYDLKVKPTSANYLLSVFYGNEYGNDGIRTFDILIDGEVIETYTLDYNRPNDPWEYHYLEIPSRLTDGKSKVTVAYRAKEQGYTAGGVFEVRTVSARLWPYEAQDDREIHRKAASAGVSVQVAGQNLVRVEIDNSAWGDGEISAICYRPGWNQNRDDWSGNQAQIAWLDQVSLKDGKASLAFQVAGTPESGLYALLLGTKAGKFSCNFSLVQTQQGGKQDNPRPPKKGEKFSDKDIRYQITRAAKSAKKAGAVTVTGTKGKKKKIAIPAKVSWKGYTYHVEAVGKKAFQNHRKVEEITIANQVKTIQAQAFYRCEKLKSVTIGKNVTKIGDKAFMHDRKLKKIKFTGKKLKSVGKNALKNISGSAKIRVPKAKLAAYRKLLKNRGQKKSVAIVKY